MTIEIRQPELEALIQQRIDSGAFQSVEDMLLQALKSMPATARPTKANLAAFLSVPDGNGVSGAQLVAAMQASPAKDISLEPERTAMPVRNITF